MLSVACRVSWISLQWEGDQLGSQIYAEPYPRLTSVYLEKQNWHESVIEYKTSKPGDPVLIMSDGLGGTTAY